jgi:hypothetical protein
MAQNAAYQSGLQRANQMPQSTGAKIFEDTFANIRARYGTSGSGIPSGTDRMGRFVETLLRRAEVGTGLMTPLEVRARAMPNTFASSLRNAGLSSQVSSTGQIAGQTSLSSMSDPYAKERSEYASTGTGRYFS